MGAVQITLRSFAARRAGAALSMGAAVLLGVPASAATLDVCSTCGFTTVAAGLAAAASGDVVSVAAGTWDECDLLIPSGVTLSGAGAPETEIAGTACSTDVVLFLASGAAIEDLLVSPQGALDTGLFLEGSADLERLEVRGGLRGIDSALSGGGLVDLESVLIVGGADTELGANLGTAAASVDRLTVVSVAGPVDSFGLSADGVLDLSDSIVVGWGGGVAATGSCRVRGTFLIDNDVDLSGCDEDLLHPNPALDPLFVDASDVDGDFHLQSSAGSWNGSFHGNFGLDSPAVDAALPDTTVAFDEVDPQGCNLPNAGAYGGTAEASHRWQSGCPVTNATTGFGYATLAFAVATSSDGDVLELADGVIPVLDTVTITTDLTLQPAVDAEPWLRPASDWTSASLITLSNGADAPLILQGFTLGSADASVTAVRGSGASSVRLVDMVVAGSRAVSSTATDGSLLIDVQSSQLGSLEDPLSSDALRIDGVFDDNTDHPLVMTVEDSQIFASSRCLFQNPSDVDRDTRIVSVTGSLLRCATGYEDSPDFLTNNAAASYLDLDLHGNVVVADKAVYLGLQRFNQYLSISNNLVVSPSTTSIVLWLDMNPPYQSLSVVNNTVVGGSRGLYFGDEADPDTVQNNVVADTTLTAVQSLSTELDPAAFDYNLIWTTSSASNITLPPTNLINTCDPGFPSISGVFDPTFDPADYLPANVNCLTDAGNPSSSYWDGPGDRNDLGASGGPGGAAFLAALDTDADGYAGGDDCDDSDPNVHPGAVDPCGDGLDWDCSGGDAPDADGDGFEDAACSGDDCDDANVDIHPAATELACDLVDEDCDGILGVEDGDGDGSDCDPDCADLSDAACTEDCDDAAPTLFGGAPELCDGLDNDCDGVLPDDEQDLDFDFATECEGDCAPLDPSVGPTVFEQCNGLDDTCDGLLPLDESDMDGDGGLACGDDCDDSDPDVYFGAPELCDGKDNDCDATIDEEVLADVDGDGFTPCDGDCDDSVPEMFPGNPEVCDWQDNDCDGLIQPVETDGDGDGLPPCMNDCDDADPLVSGDATETCDGLDTDCDGSVPADEQDADADGYVPCLELLPPLQDSALPGDCDDGDAALHPGAPEGCDGLDTDCDGVLPSDEADVDVDGSTPCEGDCDDADSARYPAALELCDDVDHDCDGATDNGLIIDDDGDGAEAPGSCPPGDDCDDADPEVHPAAAEACDLLDTDCDGDLGPLERDRDADGWLECDDWVGADGSVSGGGDCQDLDDGIHPGADELCDGLDGDCDGDVPADETDVDGDAVRPCGGDCDDTRTEVRPGAAEACDGLDSDCDGTTPDDEADPDGDGWFDCNGDCVPDDPLVHPGVVLDVCDGRDDDCDGRVDEHDDADEDGHSTCSSPPDCQEGEARVFPGAAEACDDLDNDCDGDIDEDLPGCLPTDLSAPGLHISCSQGGRGSLGWLLLLPLLGLRRRSS